MTGDTAVLGPGSSLTGKLVGGNVVVLGEFEGDLSVSGRLRLGPESRVRAAVRANVVEIEGQYEGELHAEALSLSECARVSGVFSAARLVVREGAVFEGAVNVPARPAPPAVAIGASEPVTQVSMAPPPATVAEPTPFVAVAPAEAPAEPSVSSGLQVSPAAV